METFLENGLISEAKVPKSNFRFEKRTKTENLGSVNSIHHHKLPQIKEQAEEIIKPKKRANSMRRKTSPVDCEKKVDEAQNPWENQRHVKIYGTMVKNVVHKSKEFNDFLKSVHFIRKQKKLSEEQLEKYNRKTANGETKKRNRASLLIRNKSNTLLIKESAYSIMNYRKDPIKNDSKKKLNLKKNSATNFRLRASSLDKKVEKNKIQESKFIKNQHNLLFNCKNMKKYSQVMKQCRLTTFIQSIQMMMKQLKNTNQVIFQKLSCLIATQSCQMVNRNDQANNMYCRARIIQYIKEILKPLQQLMQYVLRFSLNKQQTEVKTVLQKKENHYGSIFDETITYLKKFTLRSIALCEVVNCNFAAMFQKEVDEQKRSYNIQIMNRHVDEIRYILLYMIKQFQKVKVTTENKTQLRLNSIYRMKKKFGFKDEDLKIFIDIYKNLC